MTKNRLRISAKKYRDNLTSEDRMLKSKIIVDKILSNIDFINSEVIGLYCPFSSEVDIKELFQVNKVIALPKIVNNEMVFIEIDDNTEYIRSNFGVLEPKFGEDISNMVQLLIISTLGRNENFRLGYGKGYYDRFINNHQKIKTIGVLFDDYKIGFKIDSWDIALDCYISN